MCRGTASDKIQPQALGDEQLTVKGHVCAKQTVPATSRSAACSAVSDPVTPQKAVICWAPIWAGTTLDCVISQPPNELVTATLSLLMKKLMLKEKSIVLTRGRVWRTVAGLEILDGREEESTCSCGPEREPWSGRAAI